MGPRLRFNPAMMPPLPFGVPEMAQPRMGDEEVMLRNYLETGEAAPMAQPQDEWDEEAWKIASLSGDPMGVREIFDKMSEGQSEDDFIKQISSLDWSSPDVASSVSKILADNPRGFTKRSESLMDMFGQLGGVKKGGGLSELARYGTEALNAAREVYQRTGDSDLAHAAAVDVSTAGKSVGKGRALTVKQQDELTNAEYEVEKAMDPVIPEDTSETKDEFNKYVSEKVAAFKAVNNMDPVSEGDWDKAHELWAKAKQADAISKLKKLVTRHDQNYYALPEHLRELVGTEESIQQDPLSSGTERMASVLDIPVSKPSVDDSVDQPDAAPRTGAPVVPSLLDMAAMIAAPSSAPNLLGRFQGLPTGKNIKSIKPVVKK